MKKVFKKISACFKDESGQGATEYILLLVVVVAVALLFKDSITKAVTDKLSELSGSLAQFGH